MTIQKVLVVDASKTELMALTDIPVFSSRVVKPSNSGIESSTTNTL